MNTLTLKNTTFKGILLGVGLLSATPTMMTPASAQQRSTVTRRTVTRRTVTRTVVRQPVVVRRPVVVQRTVVRRPVVVQRTVVRQPTVITRTVVRRPFVNSYRTIQGTVTNDLAGNDFTLRQNNGQSVRVFVPSGEPRQLSRGDLVQATGTLSGGSFRATNAVILRNR